jgi:hypothetical protein
MDVNRHLRQSDRDPTIARLASPTQERSRAEEPTILPIGASRFLGFSLEAQRVRERIRRIASSRATVLVTGETGTGKELVARAIHEESGRADWVATAVTELCDGVLESELFGHERGAFTGAVAKHVGLFEQADQGTLFLDEIGDAPAFLQAKLLRVLETGEVRPVGALRVRRTMPRVIVATHRDLEAMVRAGTFRRDLYYRIRQLVVCIPPLRERATDLEPIARALLAELAHGEGIAPPPVSPELMATLRSHAWPGNVRELRSALLDMLLVWDGASPFGARPATHPPVESTALPGSDWGAPDGRERGQHPDGSQDPGGNHGLPERGSGPEGFDDETDRSESEREGRRDPRVAPTTERHVQEHEAGDLVEDRWMERDDLARRRSRDLPSRHSVTAADREAAELRDGERQRQGTQGIRQEAGPIASTLPSRGSEEHTEGNAENGEAS